MFITASFRETQGQEEEVPVLEAVRSFLQEIKNKSVPHQSRVNLGHAAWVQARPCGYWPGTESDRRQVLTCGRVRVRLGQKAVQDSKSSIMEKKLPQGLKFCVLSLPLQQALV